MISTWELFRFYHGDGSSKDWAIHDNGNGTVTTRWGPTSDTLPSSSTRKKGFHDLVRQKTGKGYQHLGPVEMDENGRIVSRVAHQHRQVQVEPKIYWRIKPPGAIDTDTRSSLAGHVARLQGKAQGFPSIQAWNGRDAIARFCGHHATALSASGQVAKGDGIQPVLWLMALKCDVDYVHIADEMGIDITTDISAETGVLKFFNTDIAQIRPMAEALGLLRPRLNIAEAVALPVEDCWF